MSDTPDDRPFKLDVAKTIEQLRAFYTPSGTKEPHLADIIPERVPNERPVEPIAREWLYVGNFTSASGDKYAKLVGPDIGRDKVMLVEKSAFTALQAKYDAVVAEAERLKAENKKRLSENDAYYRAQDLKVQAALVFKNRITKVDQINFGKLMLERDALTAQVQRLEKERDEYRLKAEGLEAQVKDYESGNTPTWHEEYKTAQSVMNRLEDRIAELEASLAATQAENVSLKERIENMSKRIERLERALCFAKDSIKSGQYMGGIAEIERLESGE